MNRNSYDAGKKVAKSGTLSAEKSRNRRRSRVRAKGEALLLALVFSLLSAADLSAFSCGDAFVSIGDRREDVLRKCGAPKTREIREEERFFRFPGDDRLIGVLQEVEVEEWTYNLGPNRFMRILRFENGRLQEIETGDYGY